MQPGQPLLQSSYVKSSSNTPLSTRMDDAICDKSVADLQNKTLL